MASAWEQFSFWFDRELIRPVTFYKQPLWKLAQRAAAAALLGKDLEPFVPDLAALASTAQDLPQLANLVAARLLVENVVDHAAGACVTEYASNPQAGVSEGERADRDEIALGAALLTGNFDVARLARSHRTSRLFDGSVAYTAELVFLADEILRGATGDSVLFSAVRGIDSSILAAHNRTVAPILLAFGAATGRQLHAQLHGALKRYDELSFAGENAPYRLKPEQLAVDPKQSRITLIVSANGQGFRLDVILARPLLDGLSATLTQLRKALNDKDRRAFDNLRKEPETELEILIKPAAKLKARDVFARRVAAALALMKPGNYMFKKVVVNET
jgi:hypothetical protein